MHTDTDIDEQVILFFLISVYHDHEKVQKHMKSSSKHNETKNLK